MYLPLVLQWYHAQPEEHRKRPFLELSKPERVAIWDRVRAVLAGEVRRSEATVADLAIWHGRPRVGKPEMQPPLDVGKPLDEDDTQPARPRTKLTGPRLHGVKERRWHHYWDTVSLRNLCEPERSWRLFGNANVGYLQLSNMQLGGMFPVDQTFLISSWYLSLSAIPQEYEDLLMTALHESIVTLNIGDRPMQQFPALDLFLEPRQVDCFVPPRQNFSVEILSMRERFLQLEAALNGRYDDVARAATRDEACDKLIGMVNAGEKKIAELQGKLNERDTVRARPLDTLRPHVDDSLLFRVHLEGWHTRDVV
jgi:hypothetical protein